MVTTARTGPFDARALHRIPLADPFTGRAMKPPSSACAAPPPLDLPDDTSHRKLAPPTSSSGAAGGSEGLAGAAASTADPHDRAAATPGRRLFAAAVARGGAPPAAAAAAVGAVEAAQQPSAAFAPWTPAPQDSAANARRRSHITAANAASTPAAAAAAAAAESNHTDAGAARRVLDRRSFIGALSRVRRAVRSDVARMRHFNNGASATGAGGDNLIAAAADPRRRAFVEVEVFSPLYRMVDSRPHVAALCRVLALGGGRGSVSESIDVMDLPVQHPAEAACAVREVSAQAAMNASSGHVAPAVVAVASAAESYRLVAGDMVVALFTPATASTLALPAPIPAAVTVNALRDARLTSIVIPRVRIYAPVVAVALPRDVVASTFLAPLAASRPVAVLLCTHLAERMK